MTPLPKGVDFPVSGENVREADKRGAARQGRIKFLEILSGGIYNIEKTP